MIRATLGKCPVCLREYIGFKGQKFCSNKCAGKGTATQKPQCTPVPSTHPCRSCGKIFTTRSKHDFRAACSIECANNLRRKALTDPENRLKAQLSPKRKRGRTVLHSTCPNCGKSFSFNTSKRKVFCTFQCWAESNGKSGRIFLDKKEVEEALNSGLLLAQILCKFHVSYWTLLRRMKEWGLHFPKPEPKKRTDGYWNYTRPFNHRRIMEAHIGRSLLPTEQVHHINGDKSNNAIENLTIISGTGQHSRTHGSLQQCAYHFVKSGNIIFNKASCEYEVKP